MLSLLRRHLSRLNSRACAARVRRLATTGYDFREEDLEAGTSVLTAWPPPRHAQDSHLKRSLDEDKRRQRAKERAAHVDALIAAEQAKSRKAAPARALQPEQAKAGPRESPPRYQLAAVDNHADAGAGQGARRAALGRDAGAAAFMHDTALAASERDAGFVASGESAELAAVGRDEGLTACDEAPHLARTGGKLNLAVGQMLLERTSRVSLSPVTRRRTLHELNVRPTRFIAAHRTARNSTRCLSLESTELLNDLQSLSLGVGVAGEGSKAVLVDRLWRALLEEGGPSSNDLPPWSGPLLQGARVCSRDRVAGSRRSSEDVAAATTAERADEARATESLEEALAGSAAEGAALDLRGAEEGYLEAEGTQVSPYARVVTPQEVAKLLQEARCDDVAVLDVRPRECSFTDFFVLATGRSHQHIFTAAHAVKYALKQRCAEVAPGVPPRVEGTNGSDWLVVDCGATVVHVMSEDARLEYDLEGLWGPDGPNRDLHTDDEVAGNAVLAVSNEFEWDEQPVRRRKQATA